MIVRFTLRTIHNAEARKADPEQRRSCASARTRHRTKGEMRLLFGWQDGVRPRNPRRLVNAVTGLGFEDASALLDVTPLNVGIPRHFQPHLLRGEARQRTDDRRVRKAESPIAKSAPIKPITNNTGKVGTGSGTTSIGAVPVPLPGSVSPPPVTTAPFTTVPAAFAATTAVTVISG